LSALSHLQSEERAKSMSTTGNLAGEDFVDCSYLNRPAFGQLTTEALSPFFS
jgi:hypothetical protein